MMHVWLVHLVATDGGLGYRISLHSEASWKKKVGKCGWSASALDSKRDGRICNTFIGKTSLTGTILGVFISSHIMPFVRVQSSN